MNKQKASELTKYVLLVSSCVLLWIHPYTHSYCVWLDYKFFEILNSSLLYSHKWQLLWGYLNHPNESWLNIVVMAIINIIGIYSLPKDKRSKAFTGVAFFWVFFQLILLFTNKTFSGLLGIQRASPSLVITPWVVLSDALNISSLKISSNCCFPSGHVLVAIFWAKFTVLFSKKWLHPLIVITAAMVMLPRLFSGAHWLSDAVFTICYALLWFKITALCFDKIIILKSNKKLIGDA